MSLILEALRKLEREKRTPERGLVVTGATIWARREERHGLRLAVIVALGLLVGVGAWLWRGRASTAPAIAGDVGPRSSPAASDPSPSGAPRAPEELLLLTRVPPAPPSAAPARDATRTPADKTPVTRPEPAASAAPRGVAIADADEAPAPTTTEEPAGAADGAHEASPGATDSVVLQAVTERDGQPLAIVNGRLVREGDAFDGIRIVHIRASEIEVEVAGRRRIVGF